MKFLPEREFNNDNSTVKKTKSNKTIRQGIGLLFSFLLLFLQR